MAFHRSNSIFLWGSPLLKTEAHWQIADFTGSVRFISPILNSYVFLAGATEFQAASSPSNTHIIGLIKVAAAAMEFDSIFIRIDREPPIAPVHLYMSYAGHSYVLRAYHRPLWVTIIVAHWTVKGTCVIHPLLAGTSSRAAVGCPCIEFCGCRWWHLFSSINQLVIAFRIVTVVDKRVVGQAHALAATDNLLFIGAGE